MEASITSQQITVFLEWDVQQFPLDGFISESTFFFGPRGRDKVKYYKLHIVIEIKTSCCWDVNAR